MRFALALAVVLGSATVSWAQESGPTDDAPPPEPPVSGAAPVAPEAPAPGPEAPSAPAASGLPPGVAALPGERPMRFFLAGGNSVVATRIGEDAEYFWVRRDDGQPARIRKSEIVRMSYELELPAPPARRAAPERPPSLLPLDEEGEEGEDASPPGRGLIVGGAVLFGIFYGGTLLFAPGADGPGELLLIPVFGPLVYGLAREASAEDIGGLAVVTALQGAGALMLYLGLRQSAAASANRRRRTAEHGALLVLVPELSMRHVALDVTGVF